MLQLGLVALLATPLPWTAPAPAPTPIYGGDLVEPGSWPSAVAILIGDTMCTGTLVSPTVVLTAAHCLDHNPSPALMHVVVGDDVWSGFEQIVSVAEHGSHPDFCGTDTEVCKVDIWDYGYVVLEEPLVGVAPTRPISDQATWDDAMYIGAPITVVGFGDDEKSLNGFKRQVDVEIVRFSPSGLEFQAGGDGHDSCQGDSGGPAFVTLSSGEVVLAGVTSRGYTCGKGGFYAIPYAALCWLNQETGVDLRTDACETCDCLVTEPKRDDGCDCAAGGDAGGPLGLVVLAGLAGLRRPGRRRSRTSRR
ncbi:MYXO-CTERM domain-containing protein [Nannocystis exedens]|uniref:MYXO-CTERM domain-containing protein n=1 Tax=Nannocystis exedens TaxID=54 RepID=A0A1I2EDG2_9BACT|nr:trypsin-like serine protease [Nannocystis exedens]PCC74781.1 trypsin domain lipoprotein [Nannocystis exedens]SFE90982.1 MYXO-CTERM domain-containing protein [Nannocystis exedens]